jgi:cyclase
VPLTAGGGIAHLEHAARLFEAGADKIVVNSAAYHSPNLLTAIAARYGRQALVVGIDVREEQDTYTLHSDCGRSREAVTLEEHIAAVIAAGAGELMVQSIERDGVMQGYDIGLLRRIVAASSVPVIAASGAGNFQHLKEAFEVGADAAACGSLFNFGDNNPLRAKAFLKNYGVPLKRIT